MSDFEILSREYDVKKTVSDEHSEKVKEVNKKLENRHGFEFKEIVVKVETFQAEVISIIHIVHLANFLLNHIKQQISEA